MPPKRRTKSTEEVLQDDPESSENFVTIAALSEMLKIQERMCKSLFKSALKSVTMRVDDLVRTVTELKTSLKFTQKDVDLLKPTVEKLNRIEEEIDNIEESVVDQQRKLTYLENQSRRNNLLIDGIPEEEGETWETSEQKFKQVLEEKLQLQFDVHVERAHRVGRRSGDRRRNGKPRTIVCRLRDWKQRNPFLNPQAQSSLKDCL